MKGLGFIAMLAGMKRYIGARIPELLRPMDLPVIIYLATLIMCAGGAAIGSADQGQPVENINPCTYSGQIVVGRYLGFRDIDWPGEAEFMNDNPFPSTIEAQAGTGGKTVWGVKQETITTVDGKLLGQPHRGRSWFGRVFGGMIWILERAFACLCLIAVCYMMLSVLSEEWGKAAIGIISAAVFFGVALFCSWAHTGLSSRQGGYTEPVRSLWMDNAGSLTVRLTVNDRPIALIPSQSRLFVPVEFARRAGRSARLEFVNAETDELIESATIRWPGSAFAGPGLIVYNIEGRNKYILESQEYRKRPFALPHL